MCPLLLYSQIMVKNISKIKLLLVTKVLTHLLVLSKLNKTVTGTGNYYSCYGLQFEYSYHGYTLFLMLSQWV